MEATRREKLKALFEQALALPSNERAAFLDQTRRDHPALADELASLLDHYPPGEDFLDSLARAVLPQAQKPEQPREALGNDPHGLVGLTVSQYQILEKLGGGGMGVVYKAQDTKLDRTVALKFLPPYMSTDEAAKQRFIHEAKAASSLDHPNIGYIHEIDETADGRLFIAMAFYAGETLKAKIARGVLPIDEAVDYAMQVAEGLVRAHEAGIVHRDVKPANVMVTERGRAKVVDFGIAKVQDVSLTQTGTTVGTVSYMSPEQTSGEGVDHRTDLWSLGVVLYEMLAGERPFKGDCEQAVIYSVLNEDSTPLGALRPEVPKTVVQVVETLLHKGPEARYQMAEEVLADLRSLQKGGEVLYAASPPLVPSTPLWRRRAVPVGAILAALALLSLSLMITGRERAPTLNPNRIVVASFENRTGEVSLDALGSMAAYWIRQGLTETGFVEVVDAQTTEVVMQYLETDQAAGGTDWLRALGAETGAGTVVGRPITGRAIHSGFRWNLPMYPGSGCCLGSRRLQVLPRRLSALWGCCKDGCWEGWRTCWIRG